VGRRDPQRRKALLQRLGMAAATAMIFSPLFGWEVSAAWISAISPSSCWTWSSSPRS
jgi:hypothetical protein